MQALRTSSRVSPLLNAALSRYSTRPADYPWDIYSGGMFRRRLLIGESLGVQAFDVYRNFFLYHSIAPYMVPALRYQYDYSNYSKGSMTTIDELIFGAFGLFWNIGTWFFKRAKRLIQFCLPTVPMVKPSSTRQDQIKENDNCEIE